MIANHHNQLIPMSTTVEDLSQKEQVLWHLRNAGTITQHRALTDYGIQRLAARIYDLREEGHDITKEMVAVPTRAGNTDVACYRLEE